MKTIVISDLHLGPRFETSKLDFLKNLINSADKVILNGDIWESSQFSFDKFLNSPWSQLFPLLKLKEAVYIYGNHDSESDSDERVSLFSSIQGRDYLLDDGSRILIEHGNRLTNEFEKLNFLPNKRILRRMGSFVVGGIESAGIKLFGPGFSRIFFNRFFENQIIKNKLCQDSQEIDVYITGHTHRAEEYTGEFQYFNCGFVQHGHADYLEIEDQQIKLKKAEY